MRKSSDYETDDHADEQLMRSFKRSLDDILLEELVCEHDESGLEIEGRNVDGQGSGSEQEEKIEEDNLFSVSTIRDKEQERKRAKEHEQEMGYGEVPRNISNAAMRRKALKFMEKDIVREIISEHMAGLDGEKESDEVRNERFSGGHTFDPNTDLASLGTLGGEPCGESVESKQGSNNTCLFHGVG